MDLASLFRPFWWLFSRDWRFAVELCLFGKSVKGAIQVKQQQPGLFWFHSLVLTIIQTYAGGIVGTFVLRMQLKIFGNDLVICTGFATWLLTHFCPGDLFFKAVQWPVIRHVISVLSDITRAYSVIGTVIAANKVFKEATFLYPTPLAGPILSGMLAGCAASFVPVTKGLEALRFGMPFTIQQAMIGSTFYHLVVHDRFILGALLRGIMPCEREDIPMCAACIVVTFYVLMGQLQDFYGKDYNPFTFIHNFLYKITGIPKGPAKPKAGIEEKKETGNGNGKAPGQYVGMVLGKRRVVEWIYEVVKVLVVLAAVGVGVYRATPPNHMEVGDVLRPGQFLGTCTLFSQFRQCEPYLLTQSWDGNLELYGAPSLAQATQSHLLWTTGFKSNRECDPGSGLEGCPWQASLGADGRLAITQGGEETTVTKSAIWATPKPKKMGLHYELELAENRVSLISDGVAIWSVPS